MAASAGENRCRVYKNGGVLLFHVHKMIFSFISTVLFVMRFVISRRLKTPKTKPTAKKDALTRGVPRI